jgi:enamine deaminase RidA (YjgF/YER057c/UK114 family)
MQITEQVVESAHGLELNLTAVPEVGRETAMEAGEIFAAVAECARRRGARLLRDRVFVPLSQEAAYRQARIAAYGPDADSIPCTWLSAGYGCGGVTCGALGGVQAQAVLGPQRFVPLTDGGRTLGWSFEQDGYRWAMTGGLCAPQAGDAPAQARAVFELGEFLCRQAGASLADMARTWFFFDRILDCYGDFNRVRNALFIERGLMRRGQSPESVQVPASTGIGVRPIEAAGGRVALEMLAVRAVAPPAADAEPCIRRLAASGKQHCAYEYGSAFARAAELRSPAGRTVTVSGTAAIDTEGRTCHVGQIIPQIRMTIDNTLAVLRDARCQASDVVQAMAYCKTPAVAEAFIAGWRDELRWPWVIVIGDVCRDDLLFEAEATACMPVPMSTKVPAELEVSVFQPQLAQ